MIVRKLPSLDSNRAVKCPPNAKHDLIRISGRSQPQYVVTLIQSRLAPCIRAGWPWRLPTRAPTDPDVRTLAHPVPRSADSPSSLVPEAIQPSDGDMWIEPRCARHVSLDRVCQPTLRFPPQGPPERVPLPHRYYQSATTSCRSSRRASLPSLGGTSAFTRCFRSPADE